MQVRTAEEPSQDKETDPLGDLVNKFRGLDDEQKEELTYKLIDAGFS